MSHTHSLPIHRAAIMDYLPHRDPMLFIDRVTALTENTITIESDVNADADFFKGHFPGLPIMPGVLVIETVAQAGALLVSLTKGLEKDKFIAFTNNFLIKRTLFNRPFWPFLVSKIICHVPFNIQQNNPSPVPRTRI